MAQIYDHRPKTRGAGPATTEFHGAMEGLAAGGRDRELMKEAKRREDAFQRDKQRWDTEQDIMGMRLEEAQRQRAENVAVRNAEQGALDASIEDPQGKWHNIVENRLGPQQRAALERMRLDPNTPPEAIGAWLDSVGDQYRMQDTMEGLQTFSDRAQRVLQHTAGEGDASPVEDQVGELIRSVKSDPSQENLTRVTNELHKLESDFNFEQDSFKAWENAGVALDEMIVDEKSKVPSPGSLDYEEWRKVVNRIRSSERWEKRDGERHTTDYRTLLMDAKAFLNPDEERRAEQRLGARLQIQQKMKADHPELYAAMDPNGEGRVSPREFAMALQDQAQADSYDPSAIPELEIPEEKPVEGTGDRWKSDSPAVEGAPTDAAKRLQAVIESGKEMKTTGKMPEDVLKEAVRLIAAKVSRMDLEAFLAEQGWGNSNDIVEQIQKYMESQAEGVDESAKSKSVGHPAWGVRKTGDPKARLNVPKTGKKPKRAATAKRVGNRDD